MISKINLLFSLVVIIILSVINGCMSADWKVNYRQLVLRDTIDLSKAVKVYGCVATGRTDLNRTAMREEAGFQPNLATSMKKEPDSNWRPR